MIFHGDSIGYRFPVNRCCTIRIHCLYPTSFPSIHPSIHPSNSPFAPPSRPRPSIRAHPRCSIVERVPPRPCDNYSPRTYRKPHFYAVSSGIIPLSLSARILDGDIVGKKIESAYYAFLRERPKRTRGKKKKEREEKETEPGWENGRKRRRKKGWTTPITRELGWNVVITTAAAEQFPTSVNREIPAITRDFKRTRQSF